MGVCGDPVKAAKLNLNITLSRRHRFMCVSFKRLFVILLFVSLGWIGSAPAQEITSAESEVSAFLNSYSASFGTKSAEEVAVFFHVPTSVVFDTGVVVMTRSLDVIRYVQSIQNNLAAIDYAYSIWTDVRIKEIHPRLVVASTSAVRYNGENGAIAETGSTYVLRKTEEGWKIATFISHAPDRVLALD